MFRLSAFGLRSFSSPSSKRNTVLRSSASAFVPRPDCARDSCSSRSISRASRLRPCSTAAAFTASASVAAVALSRCACARQIATGVRNSCAATVAKSRSAFIAASSRAISSSRVSIAGSNSAKEKARSIGLRLCSLLAAMSSLRPSILRAAPCKAREAA